MDLEALQRQMHAAVKDQRSVAEVAETLGVDPERLTVYRRMIRAHVDTALRAHLTACVGLLGAEEGSEAWQRLFEGYLRAHPPSSWNLSEAAAAFPAYLETLIADGTPGVEDVHLCLAELEWTLYQINRDPTRLPEAVERTTLNPTLQILQFPFSLPPFLGAWWRGERPDPPPRLEAPEMVLAFRRPSSSNPCVYRATPPLLFALKVAHDGLSVDQAAEASGQPAEAIEEALASAAAIGLVLRP